MKLLKAIIKAIENPRKVNTELVNVKNQGKFWII